MKRIGYGVIAAHLLIFIWIALWVPAKKTEVKPLKVRTVVQTPPPPPKHEEMVVAKNSPPPPTPKATPIKKVAAKKPAPTPVKKPAPKAPVIKKMPAVSENLLQELQESIAKIEENSHKESPKRTLEAPKQITRLEVGQVIKGEENLFAAALIECLQSALDLPEKGAVKVELTLKNDGSFVKMEILQSKSERNKVFLEQELQMVKYPSFNGSLKKEKEHAFVITFCNS